MHRHMKRTESPLPSRMSMQSSEQNSNVGQTKGLATIYLPTIRVSTTIRKLDLSFGKTIQGLEIRYGTDGLQAKTHH